MPTFRKNLPLSRRSGFTLMELSIAILIISILIGAGMYGYDSFQNSAKKTVAKQELKTLASASANYAMDHSSKEPAKLTDLLTDGYTDLAMEF